MGMTGITSYLLANRGSTCVTLMAVLGFTVEKAKGTLMLVSFKETGLAVVAS